MSQTQTIHDVPDYDEIWRSTYGEMQEHGPSHRHMRRIIRRMLMNLDYHSVLDVGCGAGHNVSIIRAGHQITTYTGIDISEYALRQARQLYEGEFRHLDIESDSLAERYDLVFSSLLLEHIPNDVLALQNMHCMCKKYLYLTTIAGDFERYHSWDEQMGHVRNYQMGELEAKLQQVGFTIEKVVYWGFPFYSPITRNLQNSIKSFENKMSPMLRIASEVLNLAYFLNSSRRGDILFILAHVSPGL